MKKEIIMKAADLISDLVDRTKDNLNRAQRLNEYAIETLNHKAIPESWSALECLEHLNRYGNFYLPEMAKRMQASTHPAVETFKTGWLGNKFAESLLPQEPINKMNSPKKMNPTGSQLDKTVVNTFIRQQYELLDLLKQARQVNLNKVKTGITLTSFIKLKLGDTFRVVIYHTQRHIGQAERAIEQAEVVVSS